MKPYFKKNRTQLAILVDPDHRNSTAYESLLVELRKGYADIILVGGSTSRQDNIDEVCKELKAVTKRPVILFPGNPFQLSKYADAVLALSLISGRNPEFLIGKMVESAPIIHEYGLEPIPTGYIIVGDDASSAAAYMSGTTPIPRNQHGIAAQTALAGVMLGLQAIYLEAGSGAGHTMPSETIAAVRKLVDVPIIVGGGIRHPNQVPPLVTSGANTIVIGSILEHNPELLQSFHQGITMEKSMR
jgi:phosphoglycerol geranylgeranyltransferase